MTEKKQKLGWFSRLKQGLKKSSSALTEGITGIFTKKRLDASTLEELEDLLIMSDLGVAVSARVCERLAKNRFDKSISAEEVQQALAEEIGEIMEDVAKPLEVNGENTPHVILMVGVNGAGKTTTIGKMAKQFKNQGKSVMLAAGDTFRAAATQQLQIWGQRNNIPVVVGKEGCDAAGLIYDAIEKARNTNTDILMVDTAGRLQNKGYLMDELKKIIRVISKFDQTAPHNTVLILDATTGQNAVLQTEVFLEMAGITGIIMTKLDGTARGGVLVACAEKFRLPIHAIGVGETIDDLQPFDAADFSKMLVGVDIN
ncbi:MAG: signal recognition particle-docking protein FtsY [Kordiimonadaceae bacterium]|jgi:fused signal recognition particle receptor|nr:signal recognition particle-docking protein FtsY [Kordiimonadaceae bacterium]MDB4218779.1 signal recognition particle-docking protein FtsY [Emcibacteraceae bacterium]MBT6135415.1 signal recognition particle-docking protein FtsY [Kordiimonadaceae bacterium]MBT7543926.1 signal recognition particle-docking protein FtsY [Kordiimonadaceae bacterium]MBT7604214.1 signal recognition particle-docking protein FtsY [Kordiimonadaceae bacterium]|tara:strand:+ start:5571 stop:6512 length:942 start_codon:yes stop_codon:yes gene_type:complete